MNCGQLQHSPLQTLAPIRIGLEQLRYVLSLQEFPTSYIRFPIPSYSSLLLSESNQNNDHPIADLLLENAQAMFFQSKPNPDEIDTKLYLPRNILVPNQASEKLCSRFYQNMLYKHQSLLRQLRLMLLTMVLYNLKSHQCKK